MEKRPLLLIFLIVFTICCFINPKVTPVEKICGELEKGRLKGVITSIREKENSLELTIENGIFQNTNSKKICSFSKILVYLKENNNALRVGNLVYITGSALTFKKPTNLGQFNEYEYYKGKNYDCKMYGEALSIENPRYNKLQETLRHWRAQWKNVYETQLPNSQAGIVEAMVLGEKDNLDDNIKELFQNNGIGHIMAISGLHVSFLGLGLYHLLRRIGLSEWISIGCSSGFLIFYGMLTGFSVSASRAITMIILALASNLVSRTYDMLTGMAVSGIFTLVMCPIQARSCSFLLTYGAVFGIGFVTPILKEILGIRSGFVNQFLAGISVQIIILPVTAYFFYEIPTYGIIINLFILPFMSFLLILSILAVLCFLLSPFLGTFFFGSVHSILCYYEKMCIMFQKLPYSNFVIGKPAIIQIVIYYIAISIFLFFLYHYKDKYKYFLFCIPFSIILLCPIPAKGLEITMLDVGQGDSIFFRTRKTTYLMDGGSSDIKKVGTYRILPYLKARGVGTLDYMIISHTDKDHISGLIELLEEAKENQYKIGHLLLPRLANPDEAYIKIESLAKESHIQIFYLERGNGWKKDNLSVTCLHPNKNFLEEDKNECSAVLSVKYGMLGFLLTGDVEKLGEQEIVSLLDEHQILKVAHHGSDSSSTEAFLDKVKPKIALISCGKNNRYGHPHEKVLERLKGRKSRIYNTSMDGSVQIKSDGKKVEIQCYIKP